MKKFLLGIAVGMVLAGMAAVVVFFATIRFSEKPPELAEASLLVYQPEGELPEVAPVEIPFGHLSDQTPVSMVDTYRLLRRAVIDDRIKAVLIAPRNLQAGWGKLDEMRDGIEAIRKAGKPVYARLEAPGAREYYVAAAASKIYLSPEDWLDLKGLRIEARYFRGTLDKVGVQLEVEHVGKYKDAADTFTRDSMTPETRQVLNSILDDTFGRLVAAIAQSRGKRPDDIRALIEDGPFLATAAKEKGLVDGLLYPGQVEDLLKDAAKAPSLKRISHRDYLRAATVSSERGRGRPKIAVLVAQGDILRGSVGSVFGDETGITPRAMTRELRAIGDDPSIRGVILRVDSPGGDGIASDEILQEVKALRKRKPLVISMSDLAASGGYYIAMTGDPIVAYPGTLTGSIGVIFGKVNLAGLYSKIGVRTEILKRGRFADIDSESQPLTPEARQKLRESLQTFYDGFLKRVAEGRRMSTEQVHELAQGRVWLGSQAKANNLVDELGGLEKAVSLIKEKAHIDAGERVRLVVYPPKRNFWQELLGRQEQDSPWTREIRAWIGPGVAPWIDGGMLRILPYRIDIH